MTEIGIFAYEGVDARALVTVHDALVAASEDCDVEPTVYSLVPSDGVTAASGLELVPDDVLIGTPDVVVVPGGWLEDQQTPTYPEDLPERLGHLSEAGATVVGVGAGVLAVAESGLLEDAKTATVDGHRPDLADLAAAVVDAPVVQDGDVLTATGPANASDLAVRLVESTCGDAVATNLHGAFGR
jgi:transcriptional regulator GlxA family with amidase domain